MLALSSGLKYVSSRTCSVTSGSYKESEHEIQKELFFCTFSISKSWDDTPIRPPPLHFKLIPIYHSSLCYSFPIRQS
jgi:hypothetical protein